MDLPFHTRFLASLLLAGATAFGIAQEPRERSVASTRFVEAPAELPAEARPLLAPELKAESAIYVQRRLGEWLERDAREIFGEPRRHRDAYEEGVVTGDIFAFPDPSNRYREFELLFDRQNKTMRAAFIYPWRMTWAECRDLWGEEVNTTVLANGSIFRSYLYRRLDVLVDKTGKVISLGIY